jgi:hypothetical protein
MFTTNAILDTNTASATNAILDTNTGIYTKKGSRNIGYLDGEINQYYSLKELSTAYPIHSLRHVNYTAKQIYDISGSPYSPFDIVTAYNINLNIYKMNRQGDIELGSIG